MIARRERLRRLGIRDDAADLFADEVGGDPVAVDVDALIGPELNEYADQIALGPLPFKPLAPLGVGQLPADFGRPGERHADERQLRLGAIARAITLQLRPALGRGRAIAGGQGEIRSPLEHHKLGRLLGDDRDELNSRRTGAYDCDALAGEVDAVVRPAAGRERLALKGVGAVDLRRFRRREAARRHNVMAAGDRRTGRRLEEPALGPFVPSRPRDVRAEANVASEIVAIGDEAEVAQNFRLGRVFLRPGPDLLQLRIESIGIVERLNVAPRAWITVPIPGAADVVRRIQAHCRKTGFAQPVEKIEPGEAGADHGDIDVLHALVVAGRNTASLLLRHQRFLPHEFFCPSILSQPRRMSRKREFLGACARSEAAGSLASCRNAGLALAPSLGA